MDYIELFSGAGGGMLAHTLLHGLCPLAAAEIMPYPRAVLQARVRDGSLPVPRGWRIHPDVRAVEGALYRGIDMVAGGFPCSGLSLAGLKKWLDDPRSALIHEMLRIVHEARPRLVFTENTPGLRTHGLVYIVQLLQEMGYGRIAWGSISAANLGAPHIRERLWLLAQRTNTSSLVTLPKNIPKHCLVAGATYTPLALADLIRPIAPRSFLMPTLIASDARGSGNRQNKNLWSLSDRLGITRKCAKEGVLPTLAATDFRSPYSVAGLAKQLKKRSKPLRDMLPYFVGGVAIRPTWAEWYMGWPIGWTDLAGPDPMHLASYRNAVQRDRWWVPRLEQLAGSPTISRREAHGNDRIYALGMGQVPVVAAAAWEGLLKVLG